MDSLKATVLIYTIPPNYGLEMILIKEQITLETDQHLVQTKAIHWDFPSGTALKNLPANAGDMGSIPGPGRSHMTRSNYACVPQLLSLSSRDHKPQLLKPAHLEPVLHNKRSHLNVKPTHHNEE